VQGLKGDTQIGLLDARQVAEQRLERRLLVDRRPCFTPRSLAVFSVAAPVGQSGPRMKDRA
jgi:hypothetical protein